MKKNSLLGESMLLLAAFIWGIAFVAQRIGGDLIGSFTFNAVRSFIGGLTLLPIIFFTRDKNRRKPDSEKRNPKQLLLGGTLCGCLLFVACNLQQLGLVHSTASKAGFLTALYIIIVPIIGIFLKKRPGITLWISIMIALFGIYLLCATDGFKIAPADTLFMLCALVFSVHILVIDYFSPLVDGVQLSCIQFLVCGFLSSIAMFVVETPDISSILKAWIPLLYTGVLSCGVAYTFQILGQKRVNPIIASLLMSMESVFSALGGWIILGESLTKRELSGCLLLFIAIILAQIPVNVKKTSSKLSQENYS